MTATVALRAAAALGAAALVAAAAALPLWSMTMRAPQYPKGLRLYAYGTRMDGDLRELNILNHYIGMPPVEAPAFETSLFPAAIAALALLCVLAVLHRSLLRVAVVATWSTPLVILADLQWQLYTFGHSLNPTAPIRLEPFTPLVIGQTTMGNFVSSAMPSWGLLCLGGAAVLLTSAMRMTREQKPRAVVGSSLKKAAITTTAMTLIGTATLLASPPPATPLQERIDAAPAGSTVQVSAGIHRGPVVIRKAITVAGEPGAVIEGSGQGHVVSIEGSGVVFRGFTVRYSGREVTEEAAGIAVTGSRHVIEANLVEQVYFGIHLTDAVDVTVRGNTVRPGVSYGARPGNGINAWRVRDSMFAGNDIADARDGIYLSFTERVTVSRNTVSGCRYGLHSMFSQQARFEENDAHRNLLGAALMNSDRLVFERNHVRNHRDGEAAYGILLKDIGDLVAQDNWITSNRVGVYAESVPTSPERSAVLRRNVIAGNHVGFALQSTASLTLSGNRIAENLGDVRPLGRRLSPAMQWEEGGRGNSWGDYRGYDANGDGIGDVPHRVEGTLDALAAKSPLMQALLYTPAHSAVEAAMRMFPLLRHPPVVIDSAPLMTMPSWRTR